MKNMKSFFITIGKLIAVVTAGAGAFFWYKKNVEDKMTSKVNKFKLYYNVLGRWLEVKQEKKSLVSWFEKNNYKNIAIYGMGELGNHLYEELKNTNVRVVYAIDQNVNRIFSEIPVYNIYEQSEELPEVDVIVVSAVFAFDEISDELEKHCGFPVVSLEDVVFEV